jgi:hypothetical protein
LEISPATLSADAIALTAAESYFGSSARRTALAVACAFGLAGCATLVTDDHQSIVITSDPPGATCQVRQGSDFVATVKATPGTVYVGKSRHDIAVDCTRSGYYAGAAVLEPHFQDMTLGNVVYGGAVGLLVDTSTGAINEYPHWVDVFLKPQPPRDEPVTKTVRLKRRIKLRR